MSSMKRHMKKFLFMIMPGRQKNVPNGVLHVRTCCFAYCSSNLFELFWRFSYVAVGLAKAPHWWPLNWVPFQTKIVSCAFLITIKKTCFPVKKKKTGVTLPLCEHNLFLSSLKKRRKGDSAWIASNLWSRRNPNFWTRQSCFFSSDWFFECAHPFIREVKHHVYV